MPYRRLTARRRAELFYKLAALERAGIALSQALAIVGKASPPALQARIEHSIDCIQQGQSLAEAAQRSRLLLPWEVRLIQVAETTGNLGSFFSRLADHYALRAKWWGRLKSRLAFPAAVLLLALFIMPLPALIQGAIDLNGYWFRTLFPLATGYIAIRGMMRLTCRLAAGEQSLTLARLLLALPLVGALIRSQQQRDFLAHLAMLLQAGIPVVQALALAAQSIANPLLRDRFSGASCAVAEGASVSDALARFGALDEQAGALISTGEFSGRLAAMLTYQVRRLEERLNSQLDSLTEWLPRIGYAVVSGWLIGAFW